MLPLELVIAISEQVSGPRIRALGNTRRALTSLQLETARDHFNLARTCTTYHRMLVGRSWNEIHLRFRPHWMERGSKAGTTCRGIRRGAVLIHSAWQETGAPHRQCPLSPCEACEIEVALLSVNAYLDSRAGKVSKDLRELTLSGRLPKTLGSMREDAPSHTLKDAQGVCALRPEILNVELQWATWSPMMLSSFDLTRLRSLKMPVRAPLDCLKIAAAFIGMPHLANLTITELPDSQDFVDEFRHLGDGIRALSSSLRSLDISITNCNHAEAWEKDEAFVEPDDIAFLFKEFFPEPSGDQIEALVRARYNDPRESLDVNKLRSFRGPLNLQRLRLQHISLPWWTFQTAFNPETIKELDLPRCRTAPNVWNDLKNHAKLQKLANINYELLSTQLLSLLSTQLSLQSLSFARPPDIYIVAGMTSNFQGMTWVDFSSFAVTEEAPHLGPGTRWGRARGRNASSLTDSLSSSAQCQYPKKSDFVKALSNNSSLKHLVLPADMFDVTPRFMSCLGTECPALESIEWGFDYECPVSQFLRLHPTQIASLKPYRYFAKAS